MWLSASSIHICDVRFLSCPDGRVRCVFDSFYWFYCVTCDSLQVWGLVSDWLLLPSGVMKHSWHFFKLSGTVFTQVLGQSCFLKDVLSLLVLSGGQRTRWHKRLTRRPPRGAIYWRARGAAARPSAVEVVFSAGGRLVCKMHIWWERDKTTFPYLSFSVQPGAPRGFLRNKKPRNYSTCMKINSLSNYCLISLWYKHHKTPLSVNLQLF